MAEASVHEDVMRQLIELLLEAPHPPGWKLPSERELAETLKVSRPSIREAVRSLQDMGLLETRHGSGTVLAANSAALVERPLKFLFRLEQTPRADMLDLCGRIRLELGSAAASRRSESDLALLESAEDDPVAFETSLLQSTQHPVLTQIWLALLRATDIQSAPLQSDETVKLKRKFLKAVRAQKPAKAGKALKELWLLQVGEPGSL